MKKSLLLSTCLLALYSTIYAQDQHLGCGTPSRSEYNSLHPSIEQEAEQLEIFTQQFIAKHNYEKSGNEIVIPLVFHSNDPSNPQKVTLAQIQSAINILNEDFNGQNPGFNNLRPEFAGIAANIGITFCLASIDPNGQPTTGITYHNNDYDGESPDYTGSQVKSVCYWPADKYVNIWLVNRPYDNDTYSSGWAYKPSSWAYDNQIDGIVYNPRYLGYTGCSEVSGPDSWQQEMAHILSHEIGHYLNLEHTFEGYCSEPNDYVSDTPPVYYYGSTNCEQIGTKCSGVTLVNDENFMDYTYCPKMFTNGQKSRMLAALNSTVAHRNNIWSASNLQAVGCASAGSNNLAEILSESDLLIAPNPSNGLFTVQVSPGIMEYILSVENTAGQTIATLDSNQMKHSNGVVDLSVLKDGIYFITIKTQYGSITKKIVKTL